MSRLLEDRGLRREKHPDFNDLYRIVDDQGKSVYPPGGWVFKDVLDRMMHFAEVMERLPTTHHGRLRVKLAKMLNEKGIPVSPSDFSIPRGGQKKQEVVRWSVDAGGIRVDSWDTMTDCARGFTLTFNPDWPGVGYFAEAQ